MTKIESLKFIIFGDINDCTYPDTLLGDLIDQGGYNDAIIKVCLQELRKVSTEPTSVSESGGLSVSFDRSEPLKNVLQYAQTVGFVPPGEPAGGSVLYGESVAWKKKEFGE